MKQSSRSYTGLYTIGVAALFLAGFFLLVVFGAQSYQGTVANQNANNQERALLSYFSTCISSNDSRDAVSIRDSEYGQILQIADGESGYGLRIYAWEGRLRESYALLDAPLQPEQDIAIGNTDLFSAEWVQENLLRISTDSGSTLIRLRSADHGGVS